jgi:hypothetical protein
VITADGLIGFQNIRHILALDVHTKTKQKKHFSDEIKPWRRRNGNPLNSACNVRGNG